MSKRTNIAALLGALWLAFAPASPAAGEPFRTENVEIELHSARAAVAPGETFTIVLRQDIREHWHTYWRNPGDSGEPTQVLEWRLPEGFAAGDIQWPAPEPMRFDIIFSYVYSGEILFPIELTVPANARVGDNASIGAEFYWLVCADVCIPEQGAVSFNLPIAATSRDDPTWAPRIADVVADLPRQTEFPARITAGDQPVLSIALPNARDIRNPFFFAADQNDIEHGADQTPRIGGGGLSFALTPGVAGDLGARVLEGVVTYQVREAGDWTTKAFEIRATPGSPLANVAAADAELTPDLVTIWTPDGAAPVIAAAEGVAPSADLSILGVLGLVAAAFIGGLILNVMPCVLPVISIKALSLAQGAHQGAQTGAARRHGLFYAAGVLAMFAGLALVLIAMRTAGEAVGWGFQLQEPWMVAGLALLFFAIGLNLLGVFHVGGGLQDAGGALTEKGGDAGSFFTGALAVIAATPCTAPFMAGATGIVLTQSAPATLAVFASLGLGFAAPFLALSFVPALRRLIPKPGPWMEQFKNVLAFPMFAAAALLTWVLAEQTGAAGTLALLSLAVTLAFALFVARWSWPWRIAAAIIVVLVALQAWRPLIGAPPSAAQLAASLDEEVWSPERLAALRAEGRPVLVNFTAAWCVTCKVNEAVALDSPRIASAFEQRGVAFLKADWTNRDDEIAAALAEHGRAGVPLYLYYAPGADVPEVLPQLITEDMILNLIEGGAT